jgi:hypothetical protein
MSGELTIEGVEYISSKRASEITGYSQDYVGQLARAGKILGTRVGGLWYIVADSLSGHKEIADTYKPVPPLSGSKINHEVSSILTFEGKTYVSAARAAKLTSYHQDYIGQLARGGKILSRQVGKRWYVDIEALKSHKTHKDSLLGAVQAESVGILRKETDLKVHNDERDTGTGVNLHYTYKPDEQPLYPPINMIERQNSGSVADIPAVQERALPIRIIRTPDEATLNRSKRHQESAVRIARISIFIKIFSAFAIFALFFTTFNLNLNYIPREAIKFPSIRFDLRSTNSKIRASVISLSDQIGVLFSNEIRYTRGE